MKKINSRFSSFSPVNSTLFIFNRYLLSFLLCSNPSFIVYSLQYIRFSVVYYYVRYKRMNSRSITKLLTLFLSLIPHFYEAKYFRRCFVICSSFFVYTRKKVQEKLENFVDCLSNKFQPITSSTTKWNNVITRC